MSFNCSLSELLLLFVKWSSVFVVWVEFCWKFVLRIFCVSVLFLIVCLIIDVSFGIVLMSGKLWIVCVVFMMIVLFELVKNVEMVGKFCFCMVIMVVRCICLEWCLESFSNFLLDVILISVMMLLCCMIGLVLVFLWSIFKIGLSVLVVCRFLSVIVVKYWICNELWLRFFVIVGMDFLRLVLVVRFIVW